MASPELTPRLGAELIFHAFPLSQGNADLQPVMYQYLALKYSHWTLSHQHAAAILDELIVLTESFFEQVKRKPSLHLEQTKQKIFAQLKNQSDHFDNTIMSDEELGTIKDVYHDFLAGTVRADHHFLIREHGRGKDSPNQWKSYFHDLIIQPQPMRVFHEYRDLITGSRKYWRNTFAQRRVMRDSYIDEDEERCPIRCKTFPETLTHTQQIWEQKHQGQLFFTAKHS